MRRVFAVIALFCFVCLVILGQASEAVADVEDVLISSRVLPQSRTVATNLVHLGGWLQGSSREDDAAFFAEEDAQHRAWLRRKAQLLWLHQQQRGDGGGGSGARGGERKPSTPGSGAGQDNEDDGITTRLTREEEWLTRAKVGRRVTSRVQMLHNASTTTTVFVERLVNDSAVLREAVYTVPQRHLTAVSQETPWSLYNSLLTQNFPHAVHNYTAQKVIEAAHAGVTPLAVLNFFDVLPYPVLLTHDLLSAVEAELDSLESALEAAPGRDAMFARRKSSRKGINGETVTNTTTNTTAMQLSSSDMSALRRIAAANLGDVRRLTVQTRRAASLVHALALPLLSKALHQLNTAQREVQASIVANDESTEALRRELRQMLRYKAQLQSWEQRLRAADEVFRGRHASHADTTLPSSSLLPPLTKSSTPPPPPLLQGDGSAFVLGLALIARYRLGGVTGLQALDAQPLPGLVTMMTGYLESEWLRDFLHPLLRATIVTVVAEAVLLELKFGLVRRAVAARGRTVGTPTRPSLRSLRVTVAVIALLEVILPQGVSLLALWWRSRAAGVSTIDKVACLRPSQRTTLVAILLMINMCTTLLVTRLRTWRHDRGIDDKSADADRTTTTGTSCNPNNNSHSNSKARKTD